MILGAGTIIDAPTAALFIAAGASFIVGQSLSAEVARLCNRRRVAYIPGAGSATEIAAAEELGCEIVKLFPAAAFDGPAFVRNFLAPSPASRIMPTNVLATEEATRAWFEAGAACLGVGGHLYPADVMRGGDRAPIAERHAGPSWAGCGRRAAPEPERWSRASRSDAISRAGASSRPAHPPGARAVPSLPA